MRLLDYFRSSRRSTAEVAKERLQIIVSHERMNRNAPSYLPSLKQELLEVVRKYVQVDQDQIKVQLEKEGDCEVLELNITLPEPAANRRTG
jgi:cell division topological specificity factor